MFSSNLKKEQLQPMNENSYDALAFWIDSIFASKRPDEIAAFHFNRYETIKAYELQLIGAPTYDMNDSDWECDDILRADKQLQGQIWSELPNNWCSPFVWKN